MIGILILANDNRVVILYNFIYVYYFNEFGGLTHTNIHTQAHMHTLLCS